MNEKKMVGNGSKATLPGGKKMDDYKKPPSYNSITNSNAMAGSENQNQSQKSDEKQKSKGEQVAQKASSEALKTSLKAAFPYIPQFIINKLVDSDLGQEVIEKQLKGIKRKIMLYAAGIVAGIVGAILSVSIIMAAVLGPVGAISDALKNVGSFFASVGNLFVYGEFCSSKEACQAKLGNKYYETLDKKVEEAFSNCQNELDLDSVKDLITGTIFYDQMSYHDEYSSADEETIKNEEDEEKAVDENYNPTENEDGYFDYRGKRGDIAKLVKKLKSDDDNSCMINSYAYRNYLTNSYVESNYKYVLKGEFKDGVEGRLTIDEVVNEIMMIGGFENLGSNGTCSNSCTYNVNGQSINNLKVQLLDNNGNNIEGQELISFEKYILGVTYGEIGPDAPEEALKAQAIATRNYSLTRPGVMNGVGGVKLEEVDGEWILYIRNSTNDQVYCDPDKGCGKRADGVFVSDQYNPEIDPNADYKPKGPLAMDSPVRTALAEVSGKVALDSEGNIVKTSYTNTQHILWREKANEGKDYVEILKNSYSSIVSFEEGNCSNLCSFAIGPYTEWRQSTWDNIYMNSLTIKQAGCLTVSVAMQIARSGVETPLGEDFNPGTLVDNYRKYLYNGNDNWIWDGITKVVPNFVRANNYDHTMMQHLTDEKQMELLEDGIKNGCYYVAEVKSYRSGQHWVAIDTIQDSKIYIMDPASNCKVMGECVASEGFKYRISTARCYKVK